jgi:DNA repair protein RadC
MNTKQVKEYKIVPVKNEENYIKVKISSTEDAANYCRQFYFDDIAVYESFFLLLLNRANNTIGWAKISQGGITGTVADVTLIAKYVVDSLAKGAIICHNHPSGNLTPSSTDISFTQQVKAALALFDCKLLDSIILTEQSYYSMADEGKI